MARISFETAKAQYVHRYTMEHVPAWVRAKPALGDTGRFLAPHFRTDREWYDATKFPGEPGLHGNCRHCETSGQTWPLGRSLPAPYYPGVHVAD